MNSVRAWFMRLFGVFGSTRAERELSAEIESHLQLHVDDNLRAGMTPQEAQAARADRARWRRRDEGGVSRSPRLAGVRVPGARYPLRRPDAPEDAGLRAGRRRDSGPRHRRQLGDLHRGECRGAEAAAVPGSGSHHAVMADAAAVPSTRRFSRSHRRTSSTGKSRTRSSSRSRFIAADGAPSPARANRKPCRPSAPRPASSRSSALRPRLAAASPSRRTPQAGRAR